MIDPSVGSGPSSPSFMNTKHGITVGLSGALDPAERLILDNLGGTPWSGPVPEGVGLAAARKRLKGLRAAAGFKPSSTGRWLTTDTAKFKKGVKRGDAEVFAGVTLHAARGAADVWHSLDDEVRCAVAHALGKSVDQVTQALRPTVCPHATPECTNGCVVGQSQLSGLGRTHITRLLRQLLAMFYPADFFELTWNELEKLAAKHGAANVRWRTNIGDDIRWELLAPGLLKTEIPAYAYTKHPAYKRPNTGPIRIVYSATERWTNREIVRTCMAGRTVAVVFDLPRKAELPATWHGIEVVDGDVSDDLTAVPDGVIVGLRTKGPTVRIRRRLAESGFARSVDENGEV